MDYDERSLTNSKDHSWSSTLLSAEGAGIELNDCVQTNVRVTARNGMQNDLMRSIKYCPTASEQHQIIDRSSAILTSLQADGARRKVVGISSILGFLHARDQVYRRKLQCITARPIGNIQDLGNVARTAE